MVNKAALKVVRAARVANVKVQVHKAASNKQAAKESSSKIAKAAKAHEVATKVNGKVAAKEDQVFCNLCSTFNGAQVFYCRSAFLYQCWLKAFYFTENIKPRHVNAMVMLLYLPWRGIPGNDPFGVLRFRLRILHRSRRNCGRFPARCHYPYS